jgi:Na+/alanine symporter
MIKIIVVIHKWWVLKVAFVDSARNFADSTFNVPYRVGTGALYGYILTTTTMRVMTIAYPVCFFLLLFLCTPLMCSFVTLEDIVLLGCFFVLLAWSLFSYLTMLFWLWYKNKCHKISSPEDKKMVRMLMKKMLKLSPYYLATHVLFLLLANVMMIMAVPFAIIALPLNLIFVWCIYRAWIRMAAYPLRHKLFRIVAP